MFCFVCALFKKEVKLKKIWTWVFNKTTWALAMALTGCCGFFFQWSLWEPSTARLFILCHSCSFNQKFVYMGLWYDTVFLNTQRIWSTTWVMFLISWRDVKSHTRSQTHDNWLNWLLWFWLQQNRNPYNEETFKAFSIPSPLVLKTQGFRQKSATAPLCSYFFSFFFLVCNINLHSL